MTDNKSEILFVPLINFSSFKSFRLKYSKIKIVPNLGKILFPKPKLISGTIDDDLWILEYPIKNINNYELQFTKYYNKKYKESNDDGKRRYLQFDIYEYFYSTIFFQLQQVLVLAYNIITIAFECRFNKFVIIFVFLYNIKLGFWLYNN